MTIAKRLCVLGMILTPMFGFASLLGIGLGCGQDNLFAAWLLIQTLFICAFLAMLTGYNLQNEKQSQIVCKVGLLLFALAFVSSAWGLNYKLNGVWQPYADLQTAEVLAVHLNGDERTLAAEDAEQVLELMQQVKLRNPAMDGDWTPYPDAAKGERSRFWVRLANDRSYSLGICNEYYFHNGICFESANPEVAAALQSLYAELIVKYAPDGDEAQLAAE